jgi:hypothetical protein
MIIDQGKKAREINPNLETQFIDYISGACCGSYSVYIQKESIIPHSQADCEKLIKTFSIHTSGLST